MLRTFKPTLWTFFAMLGTASMAFGQGGATGTILGTVSDNTGAVLPNASITVTNTVTDVAHRPQTTAAGDYSVPDLQPGTYSVSIQAPGFSSHVVNNVTLVVAQQARLNATLTPGAAAETVQVNAGAVADRVAFALPHLTLFSNGLYRASTDKKEIKKISAIQR